MRVFTPRTEILPAAQLKLLAALRPAQELGFALYGGTAIALRLGHRQSVDFDFFSEEPLDKSAIQKTLPFTRTPDASILQDQPNIYTISTSDGVRASFFGQIEFGRIGEPEITSDQSLQVASLDDLIALKIKALFDRVEAKDYRDIAAIIRSGIGLDRGLAGGQALFGSSFAPMEALKALIHFKGGDLDTLVNAVSRVKKLPSIFIASHKLTA